MNNKYLCDDDLVYNTAARIPVCLCLDVSGSMYDCIKELEEGVNKFYDAVRGSEQASLSCEIAVVTFSTGAKCLEDFSTVDRKEPLRLSASGGTDMTEGVELALKLLEDRKQDYKQAGVEYYQPWIVIMSDGEPNNRNSLKVVQERMKEMEAGKKLVVFSTGITPLKYREYYDKLVIEKNFKPEMLEKIKVYNFMGKMIIEELSPVHRAALKTLKQIMMAKKNPTEMEKLLIDLCDADGDFSDRGLIDELVEYAKK